MSSTARISAAADARLCVLAFAHPEAKAPDNKTDCTWSDFVEELEANGHARVASKEAAGLFGLYSLKPGTTRKKENVEQVFGWVLDLDKATPEQIQATIDRLDADRLAYLLYSTHSHSDKRWKLRVVGPLAEPVTGKDWLPVWRAIVDKYTGKTSDEACKDPCRMYYWPSCPPDADEPMLIVQAGAAMDVATLDVRKPSKAGAVSNALDCDLNAKSVVDGAVRVERCPPGGSIFEHAEKLCQTMPPAISGQGGHLALLRVARALTWGLELDHKQAFDLIEQYFNPRCEPQWSEFEIDHKLESGAGEDGAPYRKGALLPPPPDNFDHLPMLVQHSGRYWFRIRESDDYARQCGRDDLLVVVNTHYSDHDMHGGEDMPTLEKIGKYSRPISSIASCYYQAKTTYNPETEQLVIGVRTDKQLLAQFDPDVEAFLEAFAGDKLGDLKQWIAGCAPERLSAPARALVVVGAKGLGKTLFAHGLARIWGVAPVHAGVLCDRFNGALANCPIVLADEKLPKELTGEAFRTVLQERRHSIEPKGKERHTHDGCIRMVAAVNDLERLHLNGTKGADDIAAIADRLFIIPVAPERNKRCLELQDKLKLADGSTVDLARLARHFRHIMATVTPTAGRFVGAAADATAVKVTLAAETQELPELFSLLRDFFNDAGRWATAYKLTTAAGIVPKRGDIAPEAKNNWPIIIQDDRVFVRAPVLGQLVGRELSEILRALKPFTMGRAMLEIQGKQIETVELSPDSLLSLDPIPAAFVEALETNSVDRVLRKVVNG